MCATKFCGWRRRQREEGSRTQAFLNLGFSVLLLSLSSVMVSSTIFSALRCCFFGGICQIRKFRNNSLLGQYLYILSQEFVVVEI